MTPLSTAQYYTCLSTAHRIEPYPNSTTQRVAPYPPQYHPHHSTICELATAYQYLVITARCVAPYARALAPHIAQHTSSVPDIA
eukprot:1740435-Rhodomonas_salina.1